MEASLKNCKILVADDEYGNVEVIIAFLKGISDRILYAPNGKLACELAIKEKPELIIMDWQMPEMNGIEAIRKLQENPDSKEIPVIMATGVMTEVANLKEALDAGAVDFLRKPFNPIEFRARTESALRIKSQHDAITKFLEQEKTHAEELLKHKERELSSAAMFESQRSALLDGLMEQLERLNKITNHVHATDIIAIEKQLKSQLDLGKSWDSFKSHFEDVHPGFFEKLTAQFDGLSVNERKLCAYIRMGMNNFEISQMTNVADSSVRKNINRLKKKLNLGADDNIRQFIYDF